MAVQNESEELMEERSPQKNTAFSFARRRRWKGLFYKRKKLHPPISAALSPASVLSRIRSANIERLCIQAYGGAQKKNAAGMPKRRLEEALFHFDVKPCSPYVLKRFRVLQHEFVWLPMIRVSCTVSHSKFMSVLVPTEEVSMQLKILGDTMEMPLSYRTTAGEILHTVWRDIGIMGGYEETELVMQFETPQESMRLCADSIPLLEIVQWKLNNSLLVVNNLELFPKDKIFKNCGFELRVVLERKAENADGRVDCCSKPLGLMYDRSRRSSAYRRARGDAATHGERKASVSLGVEDALSIALVFVFLVIFGKGTGIQSLRDAQDRVEWILSTFGIMSVLYIVLPEVMPEYLHMLREEQVLKAAEAPVVAIQKAPAAEEEPEKSISLNMSRMGLTAVPSTVLTITNLGCLDISFNSIEVLPKELGTMGLKMLNASNNKIRAIPRSLPVPVLNLQNNHLSQFESAYNYMELNLLGNPLQKFKGYAERLHIRTIFSTRRLHGSLFSLKKVSILDVEMKKFVGSFPFLVDLQLINNTLVEISINAPRLKTLLCAHNFLLQFPFIEQKRNGMDHSTLISLSLPYNSINLIPSRVWSLPIEYLNVSHNQIVRIDPSVRQTSLLHLNISGNQIKEIDNISRLAGLMCFIGSFNMLEVVFGLEAVPSLLLVDLSYNVLRALPKLPRKDNLDALKFYALGNPRMPCLESTQKALEARGVHVILSEAEDNLIKVSSIVGPHSRCIECGSWIPKEKHRKEEERRKVKATRRAQCIVKEVLAPPYTVGDVKKRPVIKIFAYFSSKNRQIAPCVEKILTKMGKCIQSESSEGLRLKFAEYRPKLREFCIDIRHKMFPHMVDILSFVIVTEKHVCTIGSDDIDLLLFRDERVVYLNSTPYLSISSFEKRKSDECIMAFPRLTLHDVSVADLIVAYRRVRSTAEVRRFMFSHELRGVSVLMVPLIPRIEHPLRKEPDAAGLRILEELSAYNIASQFIRVPVVVFTDIVNSTKLWSKDSIKMMQMSKIHNTTVRSLMRKLGGYEVKTEGDSFMMIFYDEQCAIEFGSEIHKVLLKKNWPEMGIQHNPLIYSKAKALYRGLQIRVGISKGACVVENDPITKRLDFYGKSVIEAARLCSMASGGETLITHTMYNRIKDIKSKKYIIIPRGRAILSGLETDVHHVYEVIHVSLVNKLLLKSLHVVKKCGWIFA
ncbi:uncharacterized protein NEMAJ01_0347 [Nematocida major]|uniref:uncharacterized protein n=1 Tax=Nematocida major TaxID=1912982 RepID=UPI002008E921|nr:uncharacterized protein NEMAJ01_0347 [Nematocida major]KAH9385451.1 hypothetical protein NEMAJ01_0347 [Nematocida major]